MSDWEPELGDFLKKCEEVIPEYHRFIQEVHEKLKELEQPVDLPGVATVPASIPEGKKILIVDDAEITRILIGRQFKGLSVELDFSKTAEDALTKCRNQGYDLVIIDLELGGAGGRAAVPMIRELNPGVAVLGLTAKVLESGCDVCLPKERIKETLLATALDALK